jgi:hypothetical protein
VSIRLRGAGAWRGERTVFADVAQLRPGETRLVAIDLPDLRPIRVRGRARWNGSPCPARLYLVRAEDAGSAGRPAAVVDPDASGRFESTATAGRYRAYVVHGHGGDGDLPFPEVLDLPSGSEVVEVDLHLRTRAVQLRLERAGHPLPGVSVRAIGDSFIQTFDAADDHGRAEFALPLGAHRLVALPRRPGAEAVVLPTLAVVAGDGPQEVLLPVPAAWR